LAPLKINPIETQLSSGNEAVAYFTRRDLLEEKVEPIDFIWQLPEVQKLFRKQQPYGSRRHTGKETISYPRHYYALVETWKSYHVLVEQYEVTKRHEAARRAAEFLLSCQSEQGDIRGMLANQYATYYTGAMLALLIKAGYADDPRVEKGLKWLLSVRQDDGGWTIPVLTHSFDKHTFYDLTSKYAEPVEPDRSKPFSHNWTDMALRAFAAHPKYRQQQRSPQSRRPAQNTLLPTRHLLCLPRRRLLVRFLFWWPNLVTALDTLSLMGYSKEDPDIQKALNWLAEKQAPDDLWKLSYAKKDVPVGEKKKKDNSG
jgi:hypothetical protein